MKIFVGLMSITVLLLGCGSKSAMNVTTCDVTVQNRSTKAVEEWWVDCGKGPVGLGYVPTNLFKEHGDVPAVIGSPVKFIWQFEGEKKNETNNVLGRGVKERDTFKLTITDEGVRLD